MQLAGALYDGLYHNNGCACAEHEERYTFWVVPGTAIVAQAEWHCPTQKLFAIHLKHVSYLNCAMLMTTHVVTSDLQVQD